MTTKTTFQTVIDEIADAFETDTRADGATFYKIKETAPAWLQGFAFMRDVHTAVDDRMPDDWIYEHTMRFADTLRGYDATDGFAAREQLHEIADGLVDIYTNALTAWLASHLGNVSLCEEAAEEQGTPATDLVKMIAGGQCLALTRIGEAVISAAEIEADSRDGDASGSEES